MTETRLEDEIDPATEDLDEDDDYIQPATRRRLPWLTTVLALGILIGLAFTGGVLVQKHHDKASTSANGLPAGLPAGLLAGGPPSGFPGGGGGAVTGGTDATSSSSNVPLVVGTVTSINGTTVKVKDLGGTTRTVRTTADTTLAHLGIKASRPLAAGDTVTVTGTKAAHGTVTALGITVR